MLDYARKLNATPGQVNGADLEPLRAAGFDDQGVMDIVMMVALFNFMNRASDGLGAQPEAAMEQSRARGEKRALAGLHPGEPSAGQGGG